MFRTLWSQTVWAKGAIPADEWKFRALKRVWLPVYDLIAVAIGIIAIVHGSLMLNRLFDPEMVDIMGATFLATALACLSGVASPKLWAQEMVGKIILLGLTAGYMTILFTDGKAEPPNYFIIVMLGWSMPLALFRLHLLGEELGMRRLVRKVIRESARQDE